MGLVRLAALVLILANFLLSHISGGAASSTYFPSELHGSASKLSTDEIRSFIHTATFLQNSNVMTLETKIPSLNVMTALRNFQSSKVGDYYRTLLRMWAKFGKDDRIKNKDEMFRNIDSLKIPENFKTAFKSMFDHVDGLQKVIISAARTTTVAPSTTTTTETTTEETTTATSMFDSMVSEYSTSVDNTDLAAMV